MRTFIALSLVSGLMAPAWARPDGNNDRPAPPNLMRSEVQMRLVVDGRADTAATARAGRPEPWQRAERPEAARAPAGAQRTDLPFKSEVLQKAHPGDQREMSPRPQGLDARVQEQKPAGDRMGRPVGKPALPIKTEVMLRQDHGDNREASAASPASTAKSSAAPSSARATMTAQDREMMCKMTGICSQARASDDVEDKTE